MNILPRRKCEMLEFDELLVVISNARQESTAGDVVGRRASEGDLHKCL